MSLNGCAACEPVSEGSLAAVGFCAFVECSYTLVEHRHGSCQSEGRGQERETEGEQPEVAACMKERGV